MALQGAGEVLGNLDALLPAEDSILFKEPPPASISQDTFASLDFPEFFSVDDVDFGDLEFLDLATARSEKNKRSVAGLQYFNSLATPSGYCSANYLTEESNRLSVLLSDCDPGQDRAKGDTLGLEKSLLDNLEELFAAPVQPRKPFSEDVSSNPDGNVHRGEDEVYECQPNVLNLLETKLEGAGAGAGERCELLLGTSKPEEERQVNVSSVVTTSDPAPPPNAVAKIVIDSSKKHNYTRFTFASLDDKESHSFQVETANLRSAINLLKPLNLDSVEVIRRLFRLGPRPATASPSTFPKIKKNTSAMPELISSPVVISEPGVNNLHDEEAALKASLLSFGVRIDSIARVRIASGQKFWCCPEENCQKAYGKGHELKLHILGHYDVKPFQCDEPGCNWGFVTRNKLNRHKASHSKKKAFMCNIQSCSKKFSTVYNLNSHLKLHERIFAYHCKSCEVQFQTERELQLHTSQKHKELEPELRCPEPGCNKAYFTKSTLEAHIKSHRRLKSEIKCSVCSKVFDKESRLKTHMVFHTGERPFACDFNGCVWKFPTQSKLARHKRSHNNDRRYQCVECSKGFARNEHLQQHMKTHKRESDNGGEDESAYCVVQEGLQKFYQCSNLPCAKKYVTKAAYRAHMKTVHRNGEAEAREVGEVGEEISAGQLDFVALLSCVQQDELKELELPVQVVGSEVEAVTMDTDQLLGVPVLSISQPGQDTCCNTNTCSDILGTQHPACRTINLQDLA